MGLASKVDQVMEQFVAMNSPGAVVLIGRTGQVLLRKAYGMANVTKNEALTPEHRFLIASVSKQFYGLAALILQHRGRFSLDDVISPFFPDYPDYVSRITIRNLLNHTSGIQEYLTEAFWNEAAKDENISQATVLRLIREFKELEFEPGTRWRYCNSAYVMLGYIIEQVTGQSLAQFMQDNIFGPLGMNSTVVGEAAVKLPPQATGYAFKGKDEFQEAPFTRLVVGWADGNIISCVDDLLLWSEALCTDKLLPVEELAKAFIPCSPLDRTMSRYGLGHFVSDRRGVRELHHGGGTLGFNTRLSRFPDERLTIVVLSNAAGIGVEKIMGELVEIMVGDKMPPLKAMPLSREQMSHFSGTYRSVPRGAMVELNARIDSEGSLIADIVTGAGLVTERLLPLGADSFLINATTNQHVEFGWDMGKVNSARIITNGMVLNLRRVEE